MPHSYGYRARTRHLFARKFGEHGTIPTQVYLKNYHLGDIVDIAGNGSIHKGMPHKYYHGKTGIVWNITKRAIGVELNKRVGNRILAKKIHVRVEHVKHSKCRQDFLNRVAENEKKRAEAKKAGVFVSLKRTPELPRKGGIIKTKKTKVETLTPLSYQGLGW